MRRRVCALLAAALAVQASDAAGGSKPVFQTIPAPGTRYYLYEMVEMVNGARHGGWRTEFDLRSSAGSISAIVRGASQWTAGGWKPVAVDDACRAAMHGDSASIAQVKLWPAAQTTPKLDSSFLDDCAPPGIFFPLTDILNVAVITVSESFRTQDLRSVGQAIHYAGFDAAYDRTGERIAEKSSGGEVRLAALDSRRAVIDWRPDLADLQIDDRTAGTQSSLKGTEHWAFRLEVDRRTGVLERASAIYDDLDLAIVGAPASMAHVRITRSVAIERQ
jgi:hypothetical protein